MNLNHVNSERELLSFLNDSVRNESFVVSDLLINYSFEYPFTLMAENSFSPLHDENINDMRFTFQHCIFEFPITTSKQINLAFLNCSFYSDDCIKEVNNFEGSKNNKLIDK